jgi:hypothetical protein
MKIKQCKAEGCQSIYIWARGMCKYHAYKDTPPKPLAKSPIKKKIPKPSGELVLFNAIWKSRPHICQVSKEPIKDFDIWCFAHVLSKKSFPKFRLYDKNIILVTREIHHQYDNGSSKDDPRFGWVYELKSNLKAEYNEKERQPSLHL